jgi:RNA polymerase sigma-70 factor (sigma-E family)
VAELAGLEGLEGLEGLADQLPRLQRLARLLAGQRHDADDLLADALAATYPRWRDGRVDDLGAYVRTAMVHQLGRWGRRARLALRRDHVARDWGQGGGSAERDVDERDRVLRALATLAPRRRAVVVLRFYEDLPEATIAALLGISVGTVKSQLSRGLEQLRPMLGTQDGV